MSTTGTLDLLRNNFHIKSKRDKRRKFIELRNSANVSNGIKEKNYVDLFNLRKSK